MVKPLAFRRLLPLWAVCPIWTLKIFIVFLGFIEKPPPYRKTGKTGKTEKPE
jgi:hypothetical protein